MKQLSKISICLVLFLALLCGVLVGCAPSKPGVPALDDEVKEKFEAEIKRTTGFQGDFNWYDENPEVGYDAPFVRYVGTYGDCIVIHNSVPYENKPTSEAGENSTVATDTVLRDHVIMGRTFSYPGSVGLLVYNPTIVTPSDYFKLPYGIKAFDRNAEINGLSQWLTEEQMHQILDELEAWMVQQS